MKFTEIFGGRKKEVGLVQQNTKVDDGGYSSFGQTTPKDEFLFCPNPTQLVKVFGVYMNGERNLYPDYLNYLTTKCSLHATILNFKALLCVSNGYDCDTSALDINSKVALNQLMLQFDEILDEMADNYWTSSNVYLKVLWNKDNSKILKVESVPHEKIRIKDVNKEYQPLSYEFCYDWSNVARFPRTEIVKFDQGDQENKEQLYHFQLRSRGQVIYNRPKYVAGCDWYEQNGLMGEYHTANMTNSINPSGLLEFFKKPSTTDEEFKILQGINNSFAGARKAGRLMAIFNKDVPSAAKYTPLDANKLDKTFIVLSDTIQREICYSHGIDPQILGLKTPGALGNSLSLPEAFKIFNYAQIIPAQKDLEQIVNKFIAINKIPVKIKLKGADNIFEGLTAQESAVSDSSSVRDVSITPVANSVENEAKANLRGSVGGVQGVLAIQASVSTGITDYSSGIAMLIEIFGYEERSARAILGTPASKSPTKTN